MPTDKIGREYDPARRSLAGRIGAHALHARHDSRRLTEKARRNGPNTVEWHMRRLAEEQPEWGSLSSAEQYKRGEHARAGYYARIRLVQRRARKAS